MRVLAWIVFGVVCGLAAFGIYKSLKLGLKAIGILATRGILAAIAAFLSYLILTALLGQNTFTGESLLSLSLTLGVPLLLGMVAQMIATRLPKL